MAHIPEHVENSSVEMIWKEIERIGISQGVDPSRNEVILQDTPPKLLDALHNLERIRGASISRRDDELEAIVVRLAYDGEDGVPIQSGGAVATAKPSITA
jgi:hypothetical protein